MYIQTVADAAACCLTCIQILRSDDDVCVEKASIELTSKILVADFTMLGNKANTFFL
jgi:hypothetical protein